MCGAYGFSCLEIKMERQTPPPNKQHILFPVLLTNGHILGPFLSISRWVGKEFVGIVLVAPSFFEIVLRFLMFFEVSNTQRKEHGGNE